MIGVRVRVVNDLPLMANTSPAVTLLALSTYGNTSIALLVDLNIRCLFQKFEKIYIVSEIMFLQLSSFLQPHLYQSKLMTAISGIYEFRYLS